MACTSRGNSWIVVPEALIVFLYGCWLLADKVFPPPVLTFLNTLSSSAVDIHLKAFDVEQPISKELTQDSDANLRGQS